MSTAGHATTAASARNAGNRADIRMLIRLSSNRRTGLREELREPALQVGNGAARLRRRGTVGAFDNVVCRRQVVMEINGVAGCWWLVAGLDRLKGASHQAGKLRRQRELLGEAERGDRR